MPEIPEGRKRRKRRLGAIATTAFLLLAGVAAWLFWPARPHPGSLAAADVPAPCRQTVFEDVGYVVCDIDTRAATVGVFHADAAGRPYGSLDAFDAAMAGEGRRPLLAMNAGMYHKDLSPVGLLVEGGVERHPAETADGEGNFFLKPNGILSIAADGAVAITETGAYLAKNPAPAYATQSGPMLLLDGRIHPKFDANGTSRYVRNGAGVRDQHTLVLAVSTQPVSFGSFARFFRDGLGCRDALFFDGMISSLSDGRRTVIGGKYPVGPILAVMEARR